MGRWLVEASTYCTVRCRGVLTVQYNAGRTVVSTVRVLSERSQSAASGM